ncbi:MAG: AglZ/HisF2 family acetamidino modification protein [Chitinophagales bacterium]|nr:AglZ/HisF2 family acetamidino modification protein [Chitinophagales bacterium]
MNNTNQLLPRVIPVLLLKNRGELVKTLRFKNPVYIGDPLNAVKIFNEKEADEILILDIEASKQNRAPDFEYIEQIATECFMPVTYGGAIKSIEDVQRIISCGIEKISLNTSVSIHLNLITEAANLYGSSSVVAAIDVKKDLLGRRKIFLHSQNKISNTDPIAFIKQAETAGAGEILLQSVDRDGSMNGYDLEFLREVSSAVSIPVIACGGAGTLEHFAEALRAGASAVAAGSKFVFYGKHRAVLINYPTQEELFPFLSAQL